MCQYPQAPFLRPVYGWHVCGKPMELSHRRDTRALEVKHGKGDLTAVRWWTGGPLVDVLV